tara:strand:+ start:1095 stop:1742 length:648 start_codon:yes stop_codon:yes gene_type:complete
MARKSKGKNSTRARNTQKKKEEEEQPIDTDEALEFDFAIQKATQVVTDQYEKRITAIENRQAKEMQNFMDGQRFFVKPSLLDRLLGRYKDMYLVFNHLRPFHCTACGTNHHGVNHGIESLTLDLDTALGYIDEMFDKFPEGKARLLHIQVDRRSRRQGQIVNEYTFMLKDWDRDRQKYITEEIMENSAHNKIFGSFKEDRKQWKEGKRRSKQNMP